MWIWVWVGLYFPWLVIKQLNLGGPSNVAVIIDIPCHNTEQVWREKDHPCSKTESAKCRPTPQCWHLHMSEIFSSWTLNNRQTNVWHYWAWIYFFLDMICLAINYHLVMKDQYILKFDYFAIELFILKRTKQSKIGHDNPATTTEKLTSKCAKPVF